MPGPYDPRMIAALAGPPGAGQAMQQARRRAELMRMFAGMRGATDQALRTVGVQPPGAPTAPAPQAASQQAPQEAPQPGRMSARREQLMSQGMSHADAMMQMAREGLIDPKIAAAIARAGGVLSQ